MSASKSYNNNNNNNKSNNNIHQNCCTICNAPAKVSSASSPSTTSTTSGAARVCSLRCSWFSKQQCVQCGRQVKNEKLPFPDHPNFKIFCGALCLDEARRGNWCIACGVKQVTSQGLSRCSHDCMSVDVPLPHESPFPSRRTTPPEGCVNNNNNNNNNSNSETGSNSSSSASSSSRQHHQQQNYHNNNNNNNANINKYNNNNKNHRNYVNQQHQYGQQQQQQQQYYNNNGAGGNHHQQQLSRKTSFSSSSSSSSNTNNNNNNNTMTMMNNNNNHQYQSQQQQQQQPPYFNNQHHHHHHQHVQPTPSSTSPSSSFSSSSFVAPTSSSFVSHPTTTTTSPSSSNVKNNNNNSVMMMPTIPAPASSTTTTTPSSNINNNNKSPANTPSSASTARNGSGVSCSPVMPGSKLWDRITTPFHRTGLQCYQVIQVHNSISDKKAYNSYRLSVDQNLSSKGIKKYGFGGEGNEHKRFVPLMAGCGGHLYGLRLASQLPPGQHTSSHSNHKEIGSDVEGYPYVCQDASCDVCRILENGMKLTAVTGRTSHFSVPTLDSALPWCQDAASNAPSSTSTKQQQPKFQAAALVRTVLGNVNVVNDFDSVPESQPPEGFDSVVCVENNNNNNNAPRTDSAFNYNDRGVLCEYVVLFSS